VSWKTGIKEKDWNDITLAHYFQSLYI